MNNPDHYDADYSSLPNHQAEGLAHAHSEHAPTQTDVPVEILTLALVPLHGEKHGEFERIYDKRFASATFPPNISGLRDLNNPMAAVILRAFLSGTSAPQTYMLVLSDIQKALGNTSNGLGNSSGISPKLLANIHTAFVALWKMVAARASSPHIVH